MYIIVMSWLRVLYLVYNHNTRGCEAPECGVIVNGYSTSSHDISVLCHQQLSLALKSCGHDMGVWPTPLDGVESTAA